MADDKAKESRQARLSKQLRNNLLRRKAQARERRDVEAEENNDSATAQITSPKPE